jgi:hypothetical protein
MPISSNDINHLSTAIEFANYLTAGSIPALDCAFYSSEYSTRQFPYSQKVHTMFEPPRAAIYRTFSQMTATFLLDNVRDKAYVSLQQILYTPCKKCFEGFRSCPIKYDVFIISRGIVRCKY